MPYPVAVTATHALFMLDKVQVPKSQLEEYVDGELGGDWGRAYEAFYSLRSLTRTPFLTSSLETVSLKFCRK